MKMSFFECQILSESIKNEMILNSVWKEGCPVGLDRLRLVTFSYFDFDGQQHNDGELTILEAAAPSVVKIFKELYEIKFPIQQARRIEVYKGCDETSLAKNNTCAFNYRPIVGGSLLSIHSYGLAIDVNPLQNPYLGFKDDESRRNGQLRILPAEGRDYLNRTKIKPGMVEPIVDIFKKHGFSVWGGDWNDPIDWQHFQPSRAMAQLLAIMDPGDACYLFELYTQKYQLLNAWDPNDKRLEGLYRLDSGKFMAKINRYPTFLEMQADQFFVEWNKI